MLSLATTFWDIWHARYKHLHRAINSLGPWMSTCCAFIHATHLSLAAPGTWSTCFRIREKRRAPSRDPGGSWILESCTPGCACGCDAWDPPRWTSGAGPLRTCPPSGTWRPQRGPDRRTSPPHRRTERTCGRVGYASTSASKTLAGPCFYLRQDDFFFWQMVQILHYIWSWNTVELTLHVGFLVFCFAGITKLSELFARDLQWFYQQKASMRVLYDPLTLRKSAQTTIVSTILKHLAAILIFP